MEKTAAASASDGNVKFLRHNEKVDCVVKLLLIGDSGVGKSCLLMRYCEDSFFESFITTIGIDFKVRTLEMDGKKVRVQVWDTAGQERFQTILPAYYRGAHGIMLVYDVTDAKSFENCARWAKQIETHAQPGVMRLLVANKADLSAERLISTEAGADLAKSLDCAFFESSAKSNLNVAPAFHALVQAVLKHGTPAQPKPSLPPVKKHSEGPCENVKCAK